MPIRTGYIVAAPSVLGRPSPLLCDNIDPTTHDFASLFNSVDPIDAQVVIAMKIARGSGASVVEDGSRLREVTKMDDAAQSEIRSLVREALSRLINQRDIQYKGVEFSVWDPSSQTGTAVVKWVNLRSRDKELREFPMQIGGENDGS